MKPGLRTDVSSLVIGGCRFFKDDFQYSVRELFPEEPHSFRDPDHFPERLFILRYG